MTGQVSSSLFPISRVAWSELYRTFPNGVLIYLGLNLALREMFSVIIAFLWILLGISRTKLLQKPCVH